MHQFTCAYCGREYIAKRSDSIYCSSGCRLKAHRYGTQGIIRTIDVRAIGLASETRMTEKQVITTFTRLKGVAATLDSAALTAPEQYRDVCRVVSDDINTSLKKVGL